LRRARPDTALRHPKIRTRLVLEANIQTGAEGLLTGKKVAIKDNICVSGVPMMNGSVLLEGYVPELDATVVTRILEAGGTIAGQGRLRGSLLFRCKPHLRHRRDPQSA